jgi:hypothetical protein
MIQVIKAEGAKKQKEIIGEKIICNCEKIG